jgi:hypothetical protein
VLFGLLGFASAWLAIKMHGRDATGSWHFAMLAVFILVPAAGVAWSVKKREPAPVKYTPAWFFEGLLALVAFWALVMMLWGLDQLYFHAK